MVKAGKRHLVEKLPGENGTICVFATTTGDGFRVAEPKMSEATRAP
jgi:hypothetical protein